ncbi:thioesterase domain-containing protein, partial [Pseudomonas sp. GD03869]
QAGLRGELRERLKAVLPDYMVPAHLLFLEHLPLTGNGKLDRKALPQPDASQSQQAYVAPRTVLEQSIAAIWAEVLKVERVGLTDNFFELGGNSLLLVTLKSRLAEHCGLDVKISQLMSSSTIQELVTSLGDQAPSGTSLIRLNGAQGVASLFLFHPSFGSVHCYKPLALALRHDLPVVGVACRALLEEGMDVPAWDAMVDDYVEQLLQVQPQGPYYLAGWSLGGNLAMDVAHRLEQAGHYVGFLGWIDAPAPMHVTAFWADDTRDEGQVISRDESAVEMLCLLFPASTERIVAAWEDIASRVAEPEVRRQSLSAWAAEAFGAEFQALSQELVVPEVQAVQRIKTVLDQRFAESDYKPVDVPVTCWWAARGKAEGSIESVESSMAKALGRPPFRAGLFDLNHDQLVGHPGFVRSFTDALRRVMTQQVEEATDTRPCGVD